MSIPILLNGAHGRMGQAITEVAADFGVAIAPIDKGDDADEKIKTCSGVIDFSFHTATLPLIQLCAEHNKPTVIGTTGHSAADSAAIRELSAQVPMVWAGNFSVGVNLLNYLTQKAASILSADSLLYC